MTASKNSTATASALVNLQGTQNGNFVIDTRRRAGSTSAAVRAA